MNRVAERHVRARMPSAAPARLAALLAAAGLAAQSNEPPPVVRGFEAVLVPEVTSRLASPNLTTVAWGAHLAAKHRVTAAVPALRERLATLRDSSSSDRMFAALALLDALVQTDAAPDADELQPFLTDVTRVPAFALLLRDRERNRDALRAHFRSLDDDRAWLEWRAAGSALAETKDTVLVHDLLAKLTTQIDLTVRDQPSDGHGTGRRTGGGRGRSGDGTLDVPDGHPPTVLYRLSTTGVAGAMLLVPGKEPIFLLRHVHTGTPVGYGSSESHLFGAHQRQRRAWLVQMLGDEARVLPFGPERGGTVLWHGDGAIDSVVEPHREAARDAFRATVRLCVEHDLVAEADVRELVPTIRVRLFDERGDRSVPLPELPDALRPEDRR